MEFHIDVERTVKQIGGATVDVPEEIILKGMKAVTEYIKKKYTFIGIGDMVYENSVKENNKNPPDVISMRFWETHSKMNKAKPNKGYLALRQYFAKNK
jgi:hypothetical protein